MTTKIKNGYLYRTKKGGGPMLRIRKAGSKPAPKPSLADRVAKDPALLQKALANPGLRSKLPDKYLSPQQRQQRQDRLFQEDLGDPSTPLSGSSITRAAQQLTDAALRPQYAGLDRDEKKVTTSRDAQQRWAGENYGKIADLFKSGQTAQDAAGQAGVDKAAQAQREQMAVIAEVQRQSAARQGHDADVRGAGLDGGANDQLANAAAEAQMRAASEGSARTGDAQARGDVQSAFLRNLGAATAARGGETQGAIGAAAAQDLADIRSQRRTLDESKGDKFVENLSKLRGDSVEQYLTAQGLANDQQKAKLDAQVQLERIRSNDELQRWKMDRVAQLKREGFKSSEAIAQANIESREKVAELGRQQSDTNNRRNNRNRGKNKPRFSTSELRSNAGDRDKAVGRARAAKEGGLTRKEALVSLERDFPPEIAAVAVNALYDGKVNSRNRSRLKSRFGIDVPRRYL